MNKQWTTSDLVKLFKLKDSSKTPIVYAEEKGEIPQASRVARGQILVRKWDTDQLPTIGEKFGFLKKPLVQSILCTYTPKGGVIKTTFTANLARLLAINGIKTIGIGLDFQQSFTRYILPTPEIHSIDEIGKDVKLGLYHLLFEGASINEVIQKTNLPTLDIIPETSDLNFMAKKMRVENRREYIFKNKIIPKLKDYDVIIFDCNPGWSDLTENALVASNNLIMPIACETECYEALQTNLGEIADFQEAMNINWNNYFMIPTLLENNSVSQNIYGSYLNMFKDSIIPIPIRRSVVGQEARLMNLSVPELDPKSNLANDYYSVINELWSKIATYNTLELSHE